MLREAIATSQPKREFSVADEHVYNRSGPVRWILSHLLRYPHLMASFLLAATLTNVLFSAIPRITGTAFDEVLKPQPDPRRLLSIALTILGLVLVRGLLDLINSFSVETLGQRTERDAREELFLRACWARARPSITASGWGTSWRAPTTMCASSTR